MSPNYEKPRPIPTKEFYERLGRNPDGTEKEQRYIQLGTPEADRILAEIIANSSEALQRDLARQEYESRCSPDFEVQPPAPQPHEDLSELFLELSSPDPNDF